MGNTRPSRFFVVRLLAVLVARQDGGALAAHPGLQERFEQLLNHLRLPEAVSQQPTDMSAPAQESLAAEILSLFVETSRLADIPVGATATVMLPRNVH